MTWTPEKLLLFVEVWQTSETLSEACVELGIDHRAASNTAAWLRRKIGVGLKQFKRHGPGRKSATLSRHEAERLRAQAKVWLAVWEKKKRQQREAAKHY